MNTHNTSRFRPVALALAMGAFALTLPLSAQALTMTTSGVSFSNTASVTDAEGDGATTISASLGSSAVAKFDASMGVLTGATLNLTSNRTQSAWVTSTDGPNDGNNGNVTSSGSGSSTAGISTSFISAPEVTHSFAIPITATDMCKDNRQGACGGTATVATPVATNLTKAVDSASLDRFVGAGTVDVARSATLTASQDSNVFTGTESTVYSLTWAGSLSATYSYLFHAAPSFADGSQMLTLNLDFGPFFVDETASLGFDLFNLSGDRVGVDLDSIVGSGDTGVLRTDLGLFSALSAGLSHSYTALLDTSSAGIFSAIYQLNFSDADVGAAASRWTYQLTLNLTGTVREREGGGVLDTGDVLPIAQNSVPEPASLALLGLGLFGLGAMRRRARA